MEALSLAHFRLLGLSLVDSVHFGQENAVLAIDVDEPFWVRRGYLFFAAPVWAGSRGRWADRAL